MIPTTINRKLGEFERIRKIYNAHQQKNLKAFEKCIYLMDSTLNLLYVGGTLWCFKMKNRAQRLVEWRTWCGNESISQKSAAVLPHTNFFVLPSEYKVSITCLSIKWMCIFYVVVILPPTNKFVIYSSPSYLERIIILCILNDVKNHNTIIIIVFRYTKVNEAQCSLYLYRYVYQTNKKFLSLIFKWL